MTTTDVILFESLQHSKTARIRFYGSSIFENYQHLYCENTHDLYSDILRYGTPENFETYRNQLSRSLELNQILTDACKFRNLETVKYLVEDCGVNPKARNDDTLFITAVNGYKEIIQYLVRFGADLKSGYYSPIAQASRVRSLLLKEPLKI